MVASFDKAGWTVKLKMTPAMRDALSADIAENVDIDIEGFENGAYGVQIMDNLAECMEEEGGYVQFVGRLTNGSHSEWVAGAQENQTANFPNMTLLEDPIESEENEEVAYNKAKELLAKYPDIKGFQGSAGTDVVGIARAVEEAGKSDSTCVMGTSIPSVSSSVTALFASANSARPAGAA